MLRKDWRNFLISADEAEEKEAGYIVFEEDEKGNKIYDLCKGIFSNLEVAKEYDEALNEDVAEENKNYATNYMDYINGSYDYL